MNGAVSYHCRPTIHFLPCGLAATSRVATGCICAWLVTDQWRAYRSAEAGAPETACGSGAQIVASSAPRRTLHSSARSKRTDRVQRISRARADRDGDSADDATYRVGGGDGLSARSDRRDPATKTKVER